MGENNFTNMSRSLSFITIALIATGAIAPNVGGVVQGSTGYVGYVFKGTTAPANGIFCNGCAMYFSGDTAQTAGDWYTEHKVAVGDTSGDTTGFFCKADGSPCTACSPLSVCTADMAGNYYKKVVAAAGAVADTTGVLCPGTNQAADCALNTCEPANAGAVATCLGTACTVDNGCMPVINGYAVPTGTNGIYCSGCVYKSSGNTASSAGNWWTCADVASGATPTKDGIFCPTGNGACTKQMTTYTAAPSAGKYCTKAAIAAGTQATTDGVLCPVVAGATATADPVVAGATATSSYAAAATQTGGTSAATTSPVYGTSGTAQGAGMVVSNSASKALFPI